MNTLIPSKLLQAALAADAVVSGTFAVLQVFAATWLSESLALPRTLLFEAGEFMIAYAALCAAMARSTTLRSGLVGVIVVGNIGWAIACIALLALGIVTPNAYGIGFVQLHAIGVLTLATWQYFGWRGSATVNAYSATHA